MIKILKNLDKTAIEEILRTYQTLDSQIQWHSSVNSKQTSVQFKKGEDHWASSVGRQTGAETDYDQLNPFFKNTIFEDIITEYNLYRSRLMWVLPYRCYSFHRDRLPRIHVPIITNEECYFLFRTGEIRQKTVDKIWLTDTRLAHTFINTSDYERLHFVGVTADQ